MGRPVRDLRGPRARRRRRAGAPLEPRARGAAGAVRQRLTPAAGNQLQLRELAAKLGVTNRLTLTYTFSTANNGNIATQNIAGTGGSVLESYTYDALNRLKTYTRAGGGSQTYVYDAFGNRAVLGTSYIPVGALTPQVSADLPADAQALFPGNRWTALGYDAAGNVASEAAGTGPSYTYDAENRVKTAAMPGTPAITYSCDGEGRRVRKELAGQATTVFVYDAAGQLAMEFGPPAGAEVQYLTADHLGSTRLVTDKNGAEVKRVDYLPFGEEYPAVGYPSATEKTLVKFTGKERDAETGLDYFGARYMSPVQGRWTSPDQINVTRARLVSPSNTLNKYAYAANNPLKFVDPDGNDVTIYYRASTGLFTKDFGHVLIGALNQKTGQVAFLDFYPKPGAWPKGEINSNMTLERLRQHGSITIQTSPEVAQKVIDQINKLTQNVPNYDLSARLDRLEVTGMTCTILCQNVLKEIGIDLGGSYLPYDVWDSAYYTFVDSYRPPLWNPGSRGPMMVPAPYQANRDFGSWRFPGVDPYWLMFTLYKNRQSAEPKGCVAVSDSATGTKSKTCE